MKLAALPLLFLAAVAPAQRNGFAQVRANLHYAPDHVLDLLNVTVDLNVNYDKREIRGTATNTFAAMLDGVSVINLQAGASLKFDSVKVDGKAAKYRRDKDEVYIDTTPLKRGQKVVVEIEYVGENLRGRGFGAGGGGFHWVEAREKQPKTRIGFWTQGEAEFNHNWVPTWDHPNDFTTSETRTTVPADWDVIGNGVMTANKLSADKKTRTVTWKMTIPHATYLLAVYGGPFDIKKDKWEGKDLWYVVPRGQGKYIDDSFGDTKDMLTFFSSRVGYKFPWPKYAQCAMYDFGGGMENVSATILGEGSLTESRAGFRNMASLNSHELGHQWFGDTVTCLDWGDTWLNESFATYMESLYMEHSRGELFYEQDVENNMRGYISSSRSLKRALSTKYYPNADANFDQHAYPKGGAILHTLRRTVGDQAFFGGLSLYLNRHQHTPVQAYQLSRAISDYGGINTEKFFDQWIFKPGHPVISYSVDSNGGTTKLTVKQLQDTSDGTPIYEIETKAGIISPNGTVKRVPIYLSKTEDTFEIAGVGAGDTVILDPDHDFLRETKDVTWKPSDLLNILKFAPNSVDRQQAFQQLLSGDTISDETYTALSEQVAKDVSQFPVFTSVARLVGKARPELRALWTSQLNHPNFQRRAEAVNGLARLAKDDATMEKLKGLVNDKEAISVVVNAIRALADWDAKGNLALFEKAAKIEDRRNQIKRAAEDAIETAKGN